jgi:hypothetical protein
MSGLLQPKDFVITDREGKERTYVISKIPFMNSKKIVTQYPTSLLPKIGDYGLHEQMTVLLMSYVGVPQKTGEPLRLTTRELIDNHVPDLQTGLALERELAQYNWGFFLQDDLSNFWERVKMIFKTFVQQTLTDSLQQLSPTEKPPSTN